MIKTATRIATVVLVLCTLGIVGCAAKAPTETQPSEPKQLPEPKPVSIEVTPSVYLESRNGTWATIFIRINPHPDNRKLRLEWDSDSGDSGSSEKDLEGENAPKVIDGRPRSEFAGHVIFYSGNYTVRIILTRSSGKPFFAEQRVTTSASTIGEER